MAALVDEVTVRIAQIQDLPALVALLQDDMLGQVREQTDDLTPYEVAWDEMQLDPNTEMLVLDLEGRVVGMATLTYSRQLAQQGLRRCTVESVRVASDLRGQGLGQALIQSCLDMARARGCGLVQLSSSSSRSDAHRFYQRLGFEASHTGFKLYL